MFERVLDRLQPGPRRPPRRAELSVALYCQAFGTERPAVDAADAHEDR